MMAFLPYWQPSSNKLAIFISARCNIYISRLCYDVSVSVCLSVTELHWRIIANLGFKLLSKFTAHKVVAAAGASPRGGIGGPGPPLLRAVPPPR